MDGSKIRVMIVDDHAMVRSGLQTFLSLCDDIELAAEAESGEEAVTLCREAAPDVVLMDLVMPGMGGVAATQQILESCAGTRVIALTSFSEQELVESALRAGAAGYLMKSVSGEELASAIRRTVAGKITLAPEAAEALVHVVANGDSEPDLTPREYQVLSLLAEGMTNSEIADQLVISRATVKTHVASIFSKLGVTNRTEAASLAARRGLV